MTTKTNDEEREPYLESVLDEALGPLAALLPSAQREALRTVLRDGAEDDPELLLLYRAARPRAVPLKSDDVASDPGAKGAEPPRAARPRRKGGAA